MTDLVIQADGLGKRYSIGGIPPGWRTLRYSLGTWSRRAWASLSSRRHDVGDEQSLWAVRNLTFSVARGEALGITGPNGSGKSTALRLASGITEPTEGWIATRGRVATLLEVGTGFHPELSGRENVVMSSIVLGMRAADARRRFDEIVEFAGVARFVDTPVKHYSSGMYLRLAFSVAVHLDSEILLLDEVLAVGDLEFQEKCLNRLESIRKEGRTVLFVTHNTAALRRLCTRAILMNHGRILLEGSPDEIAGRYESDAAALRGPERGLPQFEPGSPILRAELLLLDDNGRPGTSFESRAPWRARLLFELTESLPAVRAAVIIQRMDGTAVIALHSERKNLQRGLYSVDFVPDVALASMKASIKVELWSDDQEIYRAENGAMLTITEASPRDSARTGLVLSSKTAPILPTARH